MKIFINFKNIAFILYSLLNFFFLIIILLSKMDTFFHLRLNRPLTLSEKVVYGHLDNPKNQVLAFFHDYAFVLFLNRIKY